jgi:hypothetical protein
MSSMVNLGVKFENSTAKILEEISSSRGENKSSFIRRATLKELGRLSYLNQDRKKALGIEEAGNDE